MQRLVCTWVLLEKLLGNVRQPLNSVVHGSVATFRVTWSALAVF